MHVVNIYHQLKKPIKIKGPLGQLQMLCKTQFISCRFNKGSYLILHPNSQFSKIIFLHTIAKKKIIIKTFLSYLGMKIFFFWRYQSSTLLRKRLDILFICSKGDMTVKYVIPRMYKY